MVHTPRLMGFATLKGLSGHVSLFCILASPSLLSCASLEALLHGPSPMPAFPLSSWLTHSWWSRLFFCSVGPGIHRVGSLGSVYPSPMNL